MVALVQAALLGGTCLLGSLRAVRARAVGRYVLPLAWGSLTVALYFCYLLSWGGRLGLGMNLTPALVLPYVRHPALAAGALAVPTAVFWLVVVAIPALLLGVYLAAAPAFSVLLLRGQLRLRRAVRTPLTPRVQVGLLAGACGLIAAASAAYYRWPPTPSALVGDPIFVSLLGDSPLFPVHGEGTAGDAACYRASLPAHFARKNVVLIVVDACRADHLGLAGYGRDTTPFLDALWRAGHLHAVRSFHSASCCTFGGVMTLLRSQHWFHLTQQAFGLQDALKAAGYRVHFILGGDHSNFEHLKFYYGRNLDTYSDGTSAGRHYALNDDRGLFESSDRLAPCDGTPAFLYYHLMSVHPLGPRLSEHIRYRPASVRRELPYYLNNYDNGVVQADNNIRDLFAQLERKGYLQNSLVIITGDHGESLGERNVYGHTFNLYDEEVTPPLLIYDSESVAYRNLDFARQVDVAPTILDRLGLPIPAGWDGCSLLSQDPARYAYLRVADTYGLIDRTAGSTLKYIYDARTHKEEVYDLERDPHEQHNVSATTNPQQLSDLRTAVHAFPGGPGTGG